MTDFHFSLGSFVGGFMLGAITIALWSAGGDPASLAPFFSSTASAPETSATTSQPQSSAVSVHDQPAGTSVTVESVTVPPPGVWVAVREANGADLGNVLGAVRVTGPRAPVTVPLLRATEPDAPYAVELYRDNGDGLFNLSSDSVYVDFATGAPVIAHFVTTN